MLIKMLTLQAGPQGTREIGKVYDVPAKEAADLIKGGYAVESGRGGKPTEKTTGRRGQEQAVEKPTEPAFTPVTGRGANDPADDTDPKG